MPEKLPIVATHRQGPNDLFRLGIVDRNARVAEVHGQCRPLVPQITQRFADPAAGQCPLRRIAVQPASHAVPDRHRFAPAQLVACGGVQRLAPLFDIIQLPVERNRLRRQDRMVRFGLDELAAGMHIATGVNDPSARTLLQARILRHRRRPRRSRDTRPSARRSPRSDA